MFIPDLKLYLPIRILNSNFFNNQFLLILHQISSRSVRNALQINQKGCNVYRISAKGTKMRKMKNIEKALEGEIKQ